MREAVSSHCWGAGDRDSLCYILSCSEKEIVAGVSVLLKCDNTPVLKERYRILYKHWSHSFWNIKLKINFKKKSLYKISVTLDI